MIICVCSNLNEQQVDEAIKRGAKSPEDIFRHHNTEKNCGACTGTMHYMIDTFRSGERVLPMAPPDAGPDCPNDNNDNENSKQ